MALALRTLIGLNDEPSASRFEALAGRDDVTYRQLVALLVPELEADYFVHRFSDPTYVVGEAVVRAVAGTVLDGRRGALDLCGGSGHLTRVLMDCSSRAPVLADLHFRKLWLARRFIAPGCEAVCCDGNAPLPFARGAFSCVLVADAFQYIWTKRQAIGELSRLIASCGPGTDAAGAILITHAHNQLAWSPSHGQPLSPSGYRDLFETIDPRIFADRQLLRDIVRGGPLDLSRPHPPDVVERDPSLTIIATTHPEVFGAHEIGRPAAARGVFRINPLYDVERAGDKVVLRLRFPSPLYEEEYRASQEYLPERLVLDRAMAQGLDDGAIVPPADLLARRVVLDLPPNYL
jgi:hypothetical protein